MNGTILVICTWAFSIVAVVLSGFAIVSLLSPSENRLETIRRSAWWGFAVCLLVILSVNLFQPLHSTAAAAVVGSVVLAGVVLSVVMTYRTSQKRAHTRSSSRIHFAILVSLGLLIVAYFAVAALGPVTNYDSGLYHLGAIKYASDYSTIPGLANLYFPFGYNNSIFPFAAFLGNGPWGIQGFRLANGLVIALVLFELALRWSRPSKTVGAYVLLVGIVVALIPMVTFADYWVTSPTSDSCVFMLFLVAIAYLSDAIWNQKSRSLNSATCVVIAIVMVSLRPLMAVFLIGLIFSLAVQALYSRANTTKHNSRKFRIYPVWIAASGIGIGYLVVQSIRDYILSGWLQFPMSLRSFSVSWLAPDPVWNRTPTLGAARDPQHLWDATSGFAWIFPWLKAQIQQWEAFMLLLALLLTAGVLITALKTGSIRIRALLLTVFPSVATVIVWFVASPPSFRFAWGPVFSLAIVPLGWSLKVLADSRAWALRKLTVDSIIVGISAVSLISILGYCTIERLYPLQNSLIQTWALGPVRINYQVAPVRDALTKNQAMASGLTVLIPTESDQCWNTYPLCTAQLSPTVGLRGMSIKEGFLP